MWLRVGDMLNLNGGAKGFEDGCFHGICLLISGIESGITAGTLTGRRKSGKRQ
jgi:hypothetical protein